jgi:hypothetical protein
MKANRFVGITATAAMVLLAASCGEDPVLTAALDLMTAEELAAHVEILSADSFEGRGPSSVGEERTLAYLQEQFRAIGLEPGNGDSYLQEVPLVSIAARPSAQLTITGNGRTTRWRYGRDFMAWTTRVVNRSSINASEMIFVGYGIVAPEYGWNDYEGVDVTGKTVVILVNDPGFPTKDAALFNGNAMTYYGRLPLGRGGEQLEWAAVRPGARRQQHVARRRGGLAHARRRARHLHAGGAQL